MAMRAPSVVPDLRAGVFPQEVSFETARAWGEASWTARGPFLSALLLETIAYQSSYALPLVKSLGRLRLVQ